MDRNELERIIREKLQEILGAEKDDTFMVEASGRHVHLTKEWKHFLEKVMNLLQQRIYHSQDNLRQRKESE